MDPVSSADIGEDERAVAQRDMRDLARGALINLIGKLGRLSRGAFLWVVTLFFGLDVQGLYSISWGIVTVLSNVGRFGMQRGVVRFVVEGRTAGDEAKVEGAIAVGLILALGMSLATALAIWLAADRIAEFYRKPIAPALRIMAWSCPFMNLAWVLVAATRALRIMRYEVYVMSIGGPLVLLLSGLAISPFDTGLEGVAWVQGFMGVACLLLAIYYFQRHFSLRRCLRRLGPATLWREMFRFAVPVTGTDLLFNVLTQLDVLMLGFFVSDTRVGIFALARRIASIMLKAPQAFDPIFSSIVSELSYQRRFAEMGNRFQVISRWIAIVNLPIFAGILIAGNQLLGWMAGKEFASMEAAEIAVGLQVLLLLGVGMTIQGAFAVAEPLLIMSGKPGHNFFNNCLWLLTNFLLNLWLISAYGILGAAIGALLSIVVVSGVRLLQIYLIHDIHPFSRSLGKPLLAAVGAALGGWLVRPAIGTGLGSLLALLAIFLGIYVLLLRIMGLEPEDRLLWERQRRWFRQLLRGRRGAAIGGRQ